MTELDAYYATPEENRIAFSRGKNTGRAVSVTAILSVIGTMAAVASLPVWGLWAAGAVVFSVLVSNTIGFLMDKDKASQSGVGEAVLKNPALKNQKAGLYKEGLKTGLATPFKGLPLQIIGAPFWPVIFAAGPFINKGTKGYYFFPDRKTQLSEQKSDPAQYSKLSGLKTKLSEKFKKVSGKFKIRKNYENKKIPPSSKPN